MGLTAQQRKKLPRSAFHIAPKGAPRSQWKYPMPTKAQARAAGISEGQRQRTLRNAVARAAQGHTASSKASVHAKAKRLSGPTPGEWDASHHARRRGSTSSGGRRRTTTTRSTARASRARTTRGRRRRSTRGGRRSRR